jgi:ribonuclease P protein component
MGLLVLNFIIIAKKFTYNNSEKLKSRKVIEHLFNKGKSLTVFPVKVLYDFVVKEEFPLQAGVTVSSRTFKKAVQRNRVKRVIREVYRLEKLPLQTILAQQQKSLVLFFIYIGKELPVFLEVHEKMRVVLQKLADNISKQTGKS